MTDRVIGERVFPHGQCRMVDLDRNGRQYVLDSQGRRVHGVWLLPADEDTMDLPIIVGARP